MSLLRSVALASAALGLASAVRDEARNVTRIFGFDNNRAALQRHSINHYSKGRGSIATGNRWGGPHLHQREIDRRLRQAAHTAGAVS